MCCGSWGRKELDKTERLNWNWIYICTCIHIYKKKERKAGDLKLTKHNEREKIITNISQNTKKKKI